MRQLKSTSVTKAHVSNGPVVTSRVTFFLKLVPCWSLAQSSTHVEMSVPMGSVFPEPNRRPQRECLMKGDQEQNPRVKHRPEGQFPRNLVREPGAFGETLFTLLMAGL